MVAGLVDTSVIVDLIRGFPNAYQWLGSIQDELGVTYFVWLEVLQGAANKQKQRDAIQLLADFELIETNAEDVKWAVESLARVGLTHNVDALDSLIAATSYRLQIPLYTRNMKHFSPLLGNLAVLPYPA